MRTRLTPGKAFTSLALFNILGGRITAMPNIISNAIEAHVSVKRIAAFLAKGEVQHGARLFPRPIPQSKPRFPRRISGICHFICVVNAYYTGSSNPIF